MAAEEDGGLKKHHSSYNPTATFYDGRFKEPASLEEKTLYKFNLECSRCDRTVVSKFPLNPDGCLTGFTCDMEDVEAMKRKGHRGGDGRPPDMNSPKPKAALRMNTKEKPRPVWGTLQCASLAWRERKGEKERFYIVKIGPDAMREMWKQKFQVEAGGSPVRHGPFTDPEEAAPPPNRRPPQEDDDDDDPRHVVGRPQPSSDQGILPGNRNPASIEKKSESGSASQLSNPGSSSNPEYPTLLGAILPNPFAKNHDSHQRSASFPDGGTVVSEDFGEQDQVDVNQTEEEDRHGGGSSSEQPALLSSEETRPPHNAAPQKPGGENREQERVRGQLQGASKDRQGSSLEQRERENQLAHNTFFDSESDSDEVVDDSGDAHPGFSSSSVAPNHASQQPLGPSGGSPGGVASSISVEQDDVKPPKNGLQSLNAAFAAEEEIVDDSASVNAPAHPGFSSSSVAPNRVSIRFSSSPAVLRVIPPLSCRRQSQHTSITHTHSCVLPVQIQYHIRKTGRTRVSEPLCVYKGTGIILCSAIPAARGEI